MYPQDMLCSLVFMVAKKNLLTSYNEVKEQFMFILYPERVLSVQGEE